MLPLLLSLRKGLESYKPETVDEDQTIYIFIINHNIAGSSTLMNGINALIKGTPESSLTLLLPCEDSVRSWQSTTWKSFLARAWPCWHLDLRLPVSRTVTINSCCLWTTIVLCYSSPKPTKTVAMQSSLFVTTTAKNLQELTEKPLKLYSKVTECTRNKIFYPENFLLKCISFIINKNIQKYWMRRMTFINQNIKLTELSKESCMERYVHMLRKEG